MKTLKELSHDTFYNMQNYNQITIDLVSDAEDLYTYYEGETSFGALAYAVSTVLEVIDKSLEHDVKALETLYFILSSEVYGHRL
jgi:hypothetical protein